MTPSDRGRMIWKIGDLILEHAGELAGPAQPGPRFALSGQAWGGPRARIAPARMRDAVVASTR